MFQPQTLENEACELMVSRVLARLALVLQQSGAQATLGGEAAGGTLAAQRLLSGSRLWGYDLMF